MKRILILVLGVFIFMNADAQVKKIDRSKRPVAGPAPIINLKDPVIYHMPNGMTLLVVEDHKLPKVSASLIIDAGPVKEGNKAGHLALMGQMLEEGTTQMAKADFDEAIDQMGANVNLSSSGASASALTRYFPKAFELMTQALRHPSFPEAALEKLRKQALTGLKSQEKSAPAIAARLNNALAYGKNTAMGEFETEETINAITLQDIKDAYNNYITPSRSYLTFVGDITPAAAKALVEKYLGNWTGKKLTLPSIPDAENPVRSEIDIVNVPTAVQAEIRMGNLVTNPMNGSNYHASLLANYILGGSADAKLFMNLREKHGFTYGSYSSLGSGRFQSMFSASAAVRTDKTDSAVAEIAKEIISMRDGNITAEELATAKAAYNGYFALNMEDPARSAKLASNILINDLPKDFYKTYLTKINAVSIDDIKKVSKEYFSEGRSRIVIAGNADRIIPNLMRLGYPIKKYDRYADPVVEKPADVNVAETPKTTDKVSAYSIVEDYLKAIGGKEAIKGITSIHTDISLEMMGRSFEGTSKQMNPNKRNKELKMGDMTIFKQVFNGTNGYMVQGGQKLDMTEDQIKEMADEKGVFPQLYYTTSDYKLDYLGAGKVDGEATYRLKVIMPSGKTSVQQYSTKTGLLLQEENTDAKGEVETVNYSNYKKVGNILFPFSIVRNAGGQEIPLTITAVKFNEGVSDSDFQ